MLFDAIIDAITMITVLYNIIELFRRVLFFNIPVFYYNFESGIFTEFGGMCVGIMGFHSSGSSPAIGFKRYSAVKSMIG